MKFNLNDNVFIKSYCTDGESMDIIRTNRYHINFDMVKGGFMHISKKSAGGMIGC